MPKMLPKSHAGKTPTSYEQALLTLLISSIRFFENCQELPGRDQGD
jgi:hypothetical protein